MNKKLVMGIILIIVLIILGVIGLSVYNSNQNENNKDNVGNNEAEINNSKEGILTGTNEESHKILVVYYSAQSHTKSVAEKIANNLNADIFQIVPEQIYTSKDLDWTDDNSRVSKEHNDESLRNIKLTKTKVDNFENYDTILIGYPIWWGIAAWPIDSFIKANNFNGKTNSR